MSNYSILQINTLDGLSAAAGLLYLKLLDVYEAHKSKDNERRASEAARYDERCGSTIDYILQYGPFENMNPKLKTDLLEFFAQRWRYNFMDKPQ